MLRTTGNALYQNIAISRNINRKASPKQQGCWLGLVQLVLWLGVNYWAESTTYISLDAAVSAFPLGRIWFKCFRLWRWSTGCCWNSLCYFFLGRLKLVKLLPSSLLTASSPFRFHAMWKYHRDMPHIEWESYVPFYLKWIKDCWFFKKFPRYGIKLPRAPLSSISLYYGNRKHQPIYMSNSNSVRQ